MLTLNLRRTPQLMLALVQQVSGAWQSLQLLR
jgi:hypothetical protein